ncbi:MAG: hypothetical protein ACSHXK_15770 [Oceanococcus sp.]
MKSSLVSVRSLSRANSIRSTKDIILLLVHLPPHSAKRANYKAICATVLTMLSFATSQKAQAANYECSEIGRDWQELGWHIAARVKYKFVTHPNTQYTIGTGVFAWGEPRGSKHTATGTTEISAYGYGSIAAKSDVLDTLKICFTASDIDPITIFSAEF